MGIQKNRLISLLSSQNIYQFNGQLSKKCKLRPFFLGGGGGGGMFSGPLDLTFVRKVVLLRINKALQLTFLFEKLQKSTIEARVL